MASNLGELLAREGLTLVYGGGGVGLMGLMANAALAAGGQVVGVIPRFLLKREAGHPALTETLPPICCTVAALPGRRWTLS